MTASECAYLRCDCPFLAKTAPIFPSRTPAPESLFFLPPTEMRWSISCGQLVDRSILGPCFINGAVHSLAAGLGPMRIEELLKASGRERDDHGNGAARLVPEAMPRARRYPNEISASHQYRFVAKHKFKLAINDVKGLLVAIMNVIGCKAVDSTNPVHDRPSVHRIYAGRLDGDCIGPEHEPTAFTASNIEVLFHFGPR